MLALKTQIATTHAHQGPLSATASRYRATGRQRHERCLDHGPQAMVSTNAHRWHNTPYHRLSALPCGTATRSVQLTCASARNDKASRAATSSADLLTARAYNASRRSVLHARLHRSLCPSPAKTDGEASNPGPVSTAWLDDPDDHFGDEPMPHEEPEDYAFEETCLLNDTALAQTEEYEALQGNAPITPTWMGDSGMDNSVLPRWKCAELW